MITSTLPPVTVTAPSWEPPAAPPPWLSMPPRNLSPLPPQHFLPPPPHLPPIPPAPSLPVWWPSNSNGRHVRGSTLALSHLQLEKIDKKLDPLQEDIDCILSELEAEERKTFLDELESLRKTAKDAEGHAQRKLHEQFHRENSWNKQDFSGVQDALRRLSMGMASSFIFDRVSKQQWDMEYSVLRQQELAAKKELIAAYERMLPKLNALYLPKFYPGFERFPDRSKKGMRIALEELGAANLKRKFLDNQVEILISDIVPTRMGSQFGHVAIRIGGVVYGRAPAAWDIRTKETYLTAQQRERDSIGYVLQLGEEDKIKLFQSVLKKIAKDDKYSLIDHSCASEIISAFADARINIVDPRWTLGVFAPADIDNFLKHSKQVVQRNFYPKKTMDSAFPPLSELLDLSRLSEIIKSRLQV